MHSPSDGCLQYGEYSGHDTIEPCLQCRVDPAAAKGKFRLLYSLDPENANVLRFANIDVPEDLRRRRWGEAMVMKLARDHPDRTVWVTNIVKPGGSEFWVDMRLSHGIRLTDRNGEFLT